MGGNGMSGTNSSEVFAAALRDAEDRLRATGLSGRRAYAALCRHFAERLHIPDSMWLDGPDAPAGARLDRIPLTAELDLFGLAYERFFPEIFKAERGQFFTPRPLVELMVEHSIEAFHEALGIDMGPLGLTFVAGGTSFPDFLASMLVAKKGLADMAVSNAFGSNIFDVLLGLGWPWMMQTTIVDPGGTCTVRRCSPLSGAVC